jgi:hypothetical protein
MIAKMPNGGARRSRRSRHSKKRGGSVGAAAYGQQVYGGIGEQHANGGLGNVIDMKAGVVGQCGGSHDLSPAAYQGGSVALVPAAYQGGRRMSLKNIFRIPSLGIMKKKHSRRKHKMTQKTRKNRRR